MYDKPIIKKMKDIEYGDIIEVEYGDFDNFVDVVVTDIEKIDDGSIKTTGVYLLNYEPFEGYSLMPESLNCLSWSFLMWIRFQESDLTRLSGE